MLQETSVEIKGKKLIIQTGEIAKQAGGSALIRLGETMVLVTVCRGKTPTTQDFFPLQVEYREKTYAAGKIPGGFFKREGRPSEKEILSARSIDRPIRPLFPDDFMYEVQVICLILSADRENDADVLGQIGASMALGLSDIPWAGPVAGVRIARVNGELIAFPTFKQVEEADLELIVAGTADTICMVEGGGQEVAEADLTDAIFFGHEIIKQIVAAQAELIGRVGKPKAPYTPTSVAAELRSAVVSRCRNEVHAANRIPEKHSHHQAIDDLVKKVSLELAEKFPENEKDVKAVVEDVGRDDLRLMILDENIRMDGRRPDEIRPITSRVSFLPRAHGSALFTRGQTQALVSTTLGTKLDEQVIDALEGESKKTYMLHYNFPPFCTGEIKRITGTSRREIGHGHLAERSLSAILPSEETFPYTIRVVSDVLESNGSSSMATICGGSMSLMDAGVPIKTAVAGIAMGLIKEGSRMAVLSDITGTEDHLGDMDFKVAGTANGVTAFQMDIKIHGITREIVQQALSQARAGRLFVLGKMKETISESRPELSPHAPRLYFMKVAEDKIREVIGSGGKVIRGIQEATDTILTMEDDGKLTIAATTQEAADRARKMVEDIIADPEIDREYTGRVTSVMDFGAFVEILPGKEGLCHVSEFSATRVNNLHDLVKSGDMLTVKVTNVDRQGKIRLALISRPPK
jgi:polyribonucleotide nucleotidyltransferase